MILEYLPAEVASVCKTFQQLKYRTYKHWVIGADVLTPLCGLSLMSCLKSLSILGFNYHCCTQRDALSVLKYTELPKLHSITLKGFEFPGGFSNVVDAMHHFPLDTLQCCSCSLVTNQELLYTLRKLPFLKFCIVDVDVKQNVNLTAQIANELAGHVNLSLPTLEQIPKKLLAFPWKDYRQIYPRGLWLQTGIHVTVNKL